MPGARRAAIRLAVLASIVPSVPELPEPILHGGEPLGLDLLEADDVGGQVRHALDQRLPATRRVEDGGRRVGIPARIDVGVGQHVVRGDGEALGSDNSLRYSTVRDGGRAFP